MFSKCSIINFTSILAAENLKNQRKFTITGLIPATEYHVQVESHNAAGSTLADYYLYTLTENGGNYHYYSFSSHFCTMTIKNYSLNSTAVLFIEEPPPEIVEKSQIAQTFYYLDLKTAISILVLSLTVIMLALIAFICLKKSES